MRPFKAKFAAGFGIITLLAFPAFAYESCEEFTVSWAVDLVNSIDHLEEGRSIGDAMVVSGTISDLNGQEAGSIFVNSTVMPYDESLEDHEAIPFFAIMEYKFPMGRLTTAGIFERLDTGTNKDLAPTTHTYPVIGGTGIFGHVSGEMTASMDPDTGKRLLNFKIKCNL